MSTDDNPDTTRAKMIALLALLDVLEGGGDMTAIGIDRIDKVGDHNGGRFAGKLRLKFTVFATESRTMELADELRSSSSEQAMLSMVAQRIGRDDKLKFALRMIGAWSELAQRLVDMFYTKGKLLAEGRRQLPEPVTAGPVPAAHCFDASACVLGKPCKCSCLACRPKLK
jgi:hypothetical protein